MQMQMAFCQRCSCLGNNNAPLAAKDTGAAADTGARRAQLPQRKLGAVQHRQEACLRRADDRARKLPHLRTGACLGSDGGAGHYWQDRGV